jgi:MFS family permease
MPSTAVADSPAAWLRLLASVALMVLGGCGMYVVVVVLPTVQAEFGVARGEASLPYTLTMIGFGIGSMLMGKITDRYGIMVAMFIGVTGLSVGFVLAGMSSNLLQFALIHGLLIGMLGSSATFAPLIADTSLWFDRRRGIAVAICAAGNYVGGTIWPPVVQHFVESVGWRQTYFGIGIFCFATMLPLALRLRQRPPALGSIAKEVQGEVQGPGQGPGQGQAGADAASGVSGATGVSASSGVSAAGISAAAGMAQTSRPLGFSPGMLQVLLCIAGVACCVAMSMPQVHTVAYCSDLGYGAARGAQMLSLMLGFGIVSRLASGLICDRIGGLRTLLLGSVLQTIALVMFLPFDGLLSLYLVSALFGLFQGGIVPSYAIIVRELYSPREAGTRVGAVLTATMLGMALGGWMSGAIFDLTGSYDAAFLNGIAWNLLNVGIVLWLMHRSGILRFRRGRTGMATA